MADLVASDIAVCASERKKEKPRDRMHDVKM